MAEKKFRTAMNGYNKEDVHHYIEELAMEAEQKLLQREEQVKTLEHELAKAKSEITTYQSETAQVKQDFSSQLEELKKQMAVLREEKDQMKQENAALLSQQDLQVEANAEAERIMKENQRLQSRVHMLEEERDKIPAALIVAQQQADEIIHNTHEKMSQYETQMQKKIMDAYQAGMDKMVQLKSRMDGSRTMLEEMENQVRLATSRFVQTMDQARREAAELSKTFEFDQDSERKQQETEERSKQNGKENITYFGK